MTEVSSSLQENKLPQRRLRRFWCLPFLDKLDELATQYYKLKGICLYRVLFQHFGKGSYVRRPLRIRNAKFIRIGHKVSICDGVRLEVIQDRKDRTPQLTIGSNTNIEQNVHIICHNHVHIGSNVSITGHCCIVDVTHPFSDVHDPLKIGARIQQDDSFVEIGDGSFIGFGAVVLPNVRLGKCVVVGSNSVVAGDFPDYSVVAGIPARIIRQYDQAQGAWVRTDTALDRR